ncbi:MAG: hypothetical protein HYX35_02460 [Proteobacteria bacterium]|nr:hypothetical protein [Pseudomonadota bacterium]
MKKLLTTTMILGTILVIDAAQPAEAAVTQPVVSDTDQSQVTPVWWRHYGYGGYWHPNYYRGWGGGWGWRHWGFRW